MKELTKNERKQCQDYVMLMLGAPVAKVELDQKNIDFCVQQAMNIVADADVKKRASRTARVCLVQEGALSYAKEMLGRIRSKVKPGKLSIGLDGDTLLAESRDDRMIWFERLAGLKGKSKK